MGDIIPTQCGMVELRWGERTYVMGVLNLAPDSFSGDGLGGDVEQALSRARMFQEEGVDIIDVGGESTRPGSTPVSVEEELGRVIPAIERIVGEVGVPISIDTYKSEVARRAIDSGAGMINDIWGLKYDPRIADVAREYRVPLIIVQNQRNRPYNDFFPELIRGLRWSIGIALERGVQEGNIIIDPGIGFGKTPEQNLEITRRLGELKGLGRPILIGPSRKSVIGLVLDLPVDQRLEGTAAAVAIGIANGADMVRVHDAREMVRVTRMSDAIVRGKIW